MVNSLRSGVASSANGRVYAGGSVGGLLVSVVGSQLTLETVQIDVPMRNLPPDLDGLRIVQMSDLHVGSFIRLDDVEGIARQVNAVVRP